MFFFTCGPGNEERRLILGAIIQNLKNQAPARNSLLSSSFFSLFLLVVTHIRGHIAGSFFHSPPLLRFVPCISIERRLHSSLFPRRLASNCAYPRYALSAVDPCTIFLQNFFSKSQHGGIRTPGPTLVAFEGSHYTTGATGSAEYKLVHQVRN